MASGTGSLVTADTNIAVYALTEDRRMDRAEQILTETDFLSVQVLNEFANVSRRKRRRAWSDIDRDIKLLATWVDDIKPITPDATLHAVRLGERYRIAFYDALLLAVALAGGATIFYSEDMQHGLIIEDRLTIINPFLDTP